MVDKPGTLHGVGVGPGDPELLTLKAARLIANASVVAYLAANGRDSTARDIAKACIPATAEHVVIDMPMRVERGPGERAYDAGAAAIAERLKQGRDVIMLCEGDPFFYGSFMYLFARLAGSYPCAIVPGVTSMTASAAALRRPLSARNEVVKVLPATLPEDRLREELMTAESAVLIKVGRHLAKVRNILGLLNLSSRAHVIVKATHGDETVTPLPDITENHLPYFSTILVYAGAEAW
ncbi:precorrin-2 C(20)-methyltransferase [Aestuariivirga sp.]|uniref:precorrin-2 C(20)-methyltransferase n=1 Tax=Aestuariivirga sp. TaxID=2650926 RepID=UPI0025C300B1|nr:precorrin-2 C(20)-methyltransferase [Aestuariivirga sp.]MCA3556329.1 precorrin-2 C(20)-methyltransferase [Aestuariivirga sp.]